MKIGRLQTTLVTDGITNKVFLKILCFAVNQTYINGASNMGNALAQLNTNQNQRNIGKSKHSQSGVLSHKGGVNIETISQDILIKIIGFLSNRSFCSELALCSKRFDT